MRRTLAALLALLLSLPAGAVEVSLETGPEAALAAQTASISPLSALPSPQPLALSAISGAPAALLSITAPSGTAQAAPAIAAAQTLVAGASPASPAQARPDDAQVSSLYGRYFDGRLVAKTADLVAAQHIDEPRHSLLYAKALRGFLEKAAPAGVHPARAMNELRHALRAERVSFGFGWSKEPGNFPRITAVAPDSPAAGAGLRRGDVLMKLDGRSTFSMSEEELAADVERLADAPQGLLVSGVREPEGAGDSGEFLARLSAAPVRVPASHPSVAADVAGFFARLIAKLPAKQAIEAVDAGLAKMLSSLDKHTRYMKPADAKAFREEMRGEKSGFGFGIIEKDGVNRVIRVFPGTPAEAAGVQAGDILTEIDGASVRGLPMAKIQELLKRPDGAPLRAAFERAGARVELTMTPATIHMPMTYSQLFDGGRGYVRLREFSQTSHDELVLAIRELRARGAKSLVLDLRYNPGGDLNNAVQIAGAFLKAGSVVGSTRSDKEYNVAEATDDGEFIHVPLVVLINRHSASASELVSMALKENARATIVGEASYGKGSGQRGYPLPNGGTAVVTTFKWYSPRGNNVGGEPAGVQPQVRLPLSDQEFMRLAQRLAAAEGGKPLDPAQDAALAKALALLVRP